MSADRPRIPTVAILGVGVLVVIVVIGVIAAAFSSNGKGHPKSPSQLAHTLKPVEPAAVRDCLSNQGLIMSQPSTTTLLARSPGQVPLKLTFRANFDVASASGEPGTALNNVTLSENVANLSQLEIYALDSCVVQPGEAGGSKVNKSKAVPRESVTQ